MAVRGVFGKKASGIGLVVTLVVIVAIIIVMVSFIMKYKKAGDFIVSIGPGDCTEAYKSQKISDFNKTMVLYGTKMKDSSTKNPLYDANISISEWKAYLACKAAGMFTASEISAYDSALNNTAKAVYISLAEDICEENRKALAQSATKQEISDIKAMYKALNSEYSSFFGDDVKPKEGAASCPS